MLILANVDQYFRLNVKEANSEKYGVCDWDTSHYDSWVGDSQYGPSMYRNKQGYFVCGVLIYWKFIFICL